MRVLHLSAADKGGAGTAALRLHRALADRGHDSKMFALRATFSDVDQVIVRSRVAKLRHFLARAWSKLCTRRKYFFQNQNLSLLKETPLLKNALAFGPDLIVVHYISAFLSFTALSELHRATGARVAFNLLDMAHMTGGCHYTWDCDRYLAGCGVCPALPFAGMEDLSARTAAEKAAALKKIDHCVVAASTTLHDQARQSLVFADSPIAIIPIAIDPDQFARPDRDALRAGLGIGSDARVILVGAQSLDEPRKGMREMIAAMQIVTASLDGMRPNPILVVAGDAAGLPGLKDIGLAVRSLGRLDYASLIDWYVAADLFICPSLEDSGPMMINESLMAGTPVVSFRMGVAPDLIVDGRTGIIADEKTPTALAKAVLEALSWSESKQKKTRQVCRDTAISLCSLDEQVSRFAALCPGAAHSTEGEPQIQM